MDRDHQSVPCETVSAELPRLLRVAQGLTGSQRIGAELAETAIATAGLERPALYAALRRSIAERELAERPLRVGKLMALPPSERDAAAFVLLGGLSLREAAAACQTSETDLAQRLVRAATALAAVPAASSSCTEPRRLRVVEGAVPESARTHFVGCDACRDFDHALREELDRYETPSFDAAPFVEAAARHEEARVKAAAEAPPVTEPPAPRAPVVTAGAPRLAPSRPTSRGRIARFALAAVVLSAIAAGTVVLVQHRKTAATALTTEGGTLTRITGGEVSLRTDKDGKRMVGEGAKLPAAFTLSTDRKARAQVTTEGGSWIVERDTELTREPSGLVRIKDGAVLADDQGQARIDTAQGHMTGSAAKMLVTAAGDRTHVQVLRGPVDVVAGGATARVDSGQEAVLQDGRVDVVSSLSHGVGLAEGFVPADDTAPVRGVGELRARKPGQTEEKDRAVTLKRHAVKVRIAGNVARTEIDEEFMNETDDVLEGVYRFPLPPGAQMERLALEVDGKLVEGEFVDKTRAAGIFRGALHTATPQVKPVDDIVWVPGPWGDPALLEWQRAGRFELRIYPIPKRASRRVVMAYTEPVREVSGVRKYTYPLPDAPKMKIESFTADVQVAGHDGDDAPRAAGYELAKKVEAPGTTKFSGAFTNFTPNGDLSVEYTLPDRRADVSAWAFDGDDKNDPDAHLVAFAVRPKLPRPKESRLRDQVIVVDTGRSMYGEKAVRARKLAKLIVADMDRRDRVTVLACDTSCRPLRAGFIAPGPAGAEDVGAFLSDATMDGASDLVRAVRDASKVSGHDGARDLRITVLSAGVASAGYRTPDRVASAVGDAVGERTQVTTIAMAPDADTRVLEELARGGGGALVPYDAGRTLGDVAQDALNASYGATLRDVEVTLPDGVYDAAPKVAAPMRMGAEAIFVGRMHTSESKGFVTVKGRMDGEPFEAKYPVELRAASGERNAFVQRLFAAARVRDGEREGQKEKDEVVRLSRRYHVPSVHTSLLVLESEAMFKAFGIDRAGRGTAWTGEMATDATTATLDDGDGAAAGADKEGKKKSESEERKKDAPRDDALGGLGSLDGAGGSARRSAPSGGPAAAAPATPAPLADEDAAPAPAAKAATVAPRPAQPARRPPGGRGRWMRRVYTRHATVVAGGEVASLRDRVETAKRAVDQNPDARSKYRDLVRLLAQSGDDTELARTLDRWQAKDPLDTDLLASRGGLLAHQGDRDGSLRVLGGALSAPSASVTDAVGTASALAAAYDRSGNAAVACSFRVALAELRPNDPQAIAQAVQCERSQGETRAADRWLSVLPEKRKEIDAALAKSSAADGPIYGDFVLSATWDDGTDLDLALIGPDGQRFASSNAGGKVKVRDGASLSKETLAVSNWSNGSFVVEIARAKPGGGRVSGKISIRAVDTTQVVPFVIEGNTLRVARVQVRTDVQLVPADAPPGNPPSGGWRGWTRDPVDF